MSVESRGVFVVFEGLDGAGTTTQTRLLTSSLARIRPDLMVHASAEPAGGPAGTVIRQVLRKRIRGTDCFGVDRDFDPGALALLFAADRLDHYSCEIGPVLEHGGVAISDRYKLSSLAYQALSMPMEWVKAINSKAPEPDIMFFLEVTPEVAWERLSGDRVQREIFEVPDTLRAVWRNYHEVLPEIDRSRLVVINGTEPIDAIARQVLDVVTARLPAQGAE